MRVQAAAWEISFTYAAAFPFWSLARDQNHHKEDRRLCGGFCLSAGDEEIWAGVVDDLGDRGGDGVIGVTVHHDGVDVD